MHRPITYDEKAEMYGDEVAKQFTILDHDCENNAANGSKSHHLFHL